MSDSKPMKRPRCTRCGGPLVPEFELNGRVIAVKCLSCGELIHRNHRRRQADETERNMRVAPHKVSKRDCGPGRSNYQAGAHKGVEW